MYNLPKFGRFLSTSRNVVGKHKHEQLVCVETEIYSPFVNNDVYYRGYPVSKLAVSNKFLENFYLLLNPDLPSKNQNVEFVNKIKIGVKGVPTTVKSLNKLIPPNISICDFLSSSFSLINSSNEKPFDREYAHIFGQCLGILCERCISDVKYNLDSEDPFIYFSKCLLFNRELDIDDSVAKLVNCVCTLYMDHGLTSASYNARICISEGGSTFSGLICAVATHKYAIQTLNSYMVFNELEDEQIESILRSLECENNLKFPLDEITNSRRDPRCGIITQICKEHFGEDVFTKLSEIENKFSRKLYFKFDIYAFELMKRLYYHVNNAIEPNSSDYKLFNNQLKDKVVTLMIASRIAGWIAHISEQRRIGRRIEHIAAYIGVPPKLKYS